jgi:capsular exopolysaccharide synthesis family protein
LVEYARSNNEGLSDGGQTTMTKLNDISKELTAAESELNALSLDHGVAMRATIEDFPVALATTTILDLERRLYELEREDAKLSARFGDNWPEVQELRGEIEQVGRQLAVKKQEAIDNVKFQYQRALDRRQRVAESLDAQRQNVEQFNVDSLRYGILERRAEAREDLHSQLLDRLVEAYAEMEVTSSNVRVVVPASVESKPIYPRRIQGLLLAAILGLVVGLGLAVLLESTDDRVMDELDVSTLHLPVAGLIPSPGDDADGVAVPLGLPSASTALQAAGDSQQRAEERYWEAFRSLRASILLNQSREEIPRTVMITSAMPGEGKTTTVAHMAVVLSRTGARTLMVDLDLRDPSLARRWAKVGDADGGVSTLLSRDDVDAASLVKPTGLDNLFLLPAGAPTSDSIDLLNSGRLEAGMRTLRRMFDFIIIDTTSLHGVTDALTLSRVADAVLVVVAAGQTSKSVVRDACTRLTNAGGNLLGIALNRVETD